MPTKINSAGKQQNYVPAGNGDASGEYGDDSGSNKHFQSFKKPIGVEIKGQSNPIKAQKSYNGKGNQQLKDELKKKFGKETPNLKKLLVEIENADDEYSGIIGDYYKNNPQVEIKLGKNLNSKYQEQTTYNIYTGQRKTTCLISVGSGVFSDAEVYSKGGVFFHESGHGLDATYIDQTGHRSIWSFYYKSKEFDKSLSEMIEEELGQFNDVEKFNELKEIADKETNEWQQYEKEYNDLREKTKFYNQSIMNDPSVIEYSNQINKVGAEIIDLKNQLSKQIIIDSGFEATKPLTDKITQKQNELLDISHKTGDLQKKLYRERFPQSEKERKRLDELFDLKYELEKKSYNKKQIAYGDLSDMIQAVTGKTLTGMGHDDGYFDYKGVKRGKEAFAEIMSAKATNPESLKIMKKYIPNSLKIFDEIIGEIKK